MIARARRNAPQAEFIQGDIRKISLPGASHGAYSVYHCLNHLLMLPDLTEAFWNVYRALEPGAPFVFDVLTDDAYRPPRDMAMLEPGTAMLRATRYDPQTRLARLDMCFFSLEPSRAPRTDVTLWERSYSESEVRAALYEAGFRQAESTPADALGMTDEAGRVFVKTVK
jgi:SAM-dependent methyltransferase